MRMRQYQNFNSKNKNKNFSIKSLWIFSLFLSQKVDSFDRPITIVKSQQINGNIQVL